VNTLEILIYVLFVEGFILLNLLIFLLNFLREKKFQNKKCVFKIIKKETIGLNIMMSLISSNNFGWMYN